jgi:pSer/pThr/pTyr-binding forkhead associated (FHA) protein
MGLPASTRQRDVHIVRTGTLLLPGGRSVEVNSAFPSILIGRDPSCAVALADPEVSALHCEVRAEPDGVLVRDLASKNGTFVGTVRVREAFLTA